MKRILSGRTGSANLALLRTLVAMALVAPALLIPTAPSVGALDSGVGAMPNVIYIMADDLGIGDVSAYNAAGPIDTPNIDRIANEGMTLSHFRSGAPVCTPTRAATLTGQWPAQIGHRTVSDTYSNIGIPSDMMTLPQLFDEAGYHTAHFGKWHVGRSNHQMYPDTDFGPIETGFDEATLLYPDGAYYRTGPDVEVWTQSATAAPAQYPTTDGDQITEVFTDGVIDEIGDRVAAADPFFINLWYHAPHRIQGIGNTSNDPWLGSVPDSWRSNYPPASPDEDSTPEVTYEALIEWLDFQVGRILDELDAQGIADNTMIMFTSDNGGLDGALYNRPTTNLDFKGFKSNHFEGGLRVPFVVRWPDVIPANRTSSVFSASVDLFATFAEILERSDLNVDGVSLLPSLRHEVNLDASHRLLFWEGEERFPKPNGVDADNIYSFAVIENNRWKLVYESRFDSAAVTALYRLDTDPNETTNLLTVNAGKAATLDAAYRVWQAEQATVVLNERVREGTITDLPGGGYDMAGDGALAFAYDQRFNPADRDLSISMVLTPDTLNRRVVLVERPGSYRVDVTAAGIPRLIVWDENGDRLVLVSDTPIVAGETVRLTVTVDGFRTGSGGSFGKIWIDDVVTADGRIVNKGINVERSIRTIWFGGRLRSSVLSFDGTMEDILIVNRALYEPDIQDLVSG